MSKEILVELHDLLKLATSGHACPHKHKEHLSDAINKPDLWTALCHHCVTKTGGKHHADCNVYPIPKELFYLHYADILASIISRRLEGKIKSKSVYKIWNPNIIPYENKEWKDKSLLEKINSTADFSSYFKENEQIFRDRPEDMGRCPFASLYTHSELVKNWYDFLLKNEAYFETPKEISSIEKTNELIDLIEKQKEVYLCYSIIKSDTIFVRIKDTYLFKIAKSVLKDCIDIVGGVVLYELFNGIIFVLPANLEEGDFLEKMRKKLTSNFYLEVTFKKTSLPYNDDDSRSRFLKDLSQLFLEPEKRLYPLLDDEIKPDPMNTASRKAIICDLCQKAKATRESKKDTTEYLCETCDTYRREGGSFSGISEWEKYETLGRQKVAWIEVSLDIEVLLGCLARGLYMQLEETQFKEPKDFGFSIIFEFLEDYQLFLKGFKESISKIFIKGREKKIEKINVLENLFILKIDDIDSLMGILEVYNNLYKSYFPSFIKIRQSPIFLSISCANIKYPFFEHWKFFEDYKKNDLQGIRKRHTALIAIIGKGIIETEIWNMESVLRLYKNLSGIRFSRPLHKLAELAKFSEEFADRMLHTKGKDDGFRAVYEQITKLPHGLNYKSLLTLEKILGEGK
ncbi:MAG: hypothetical protein COZ68_02085 [Deltaproteobacteria bacterium CG_4_8_14_3_um_filter_43_13]|nr:MAG: hypothetical protein COS67_05890 [Deltaproteobacteria bacterium CG06_land_8_20_14_3_00_44_19]PIX26154.1 MAG: hypothetical protein COZ68_02085 [Deltaproteobacteria bacterium CG_4_8_14_3_um_filter_43_13]